MRATKILVPLAAAAALAACSDSTAPAGAKTVSLSFSTASTGSAVVQRSAFGPNFNILTASGSDTIVISSAQIVFSRIEMEQSGVTCTDTANAGDGKEEGGCEEMSTAPMLVNLPVDSSVVTGVAVAIPSGTYSSLHAKMYPIESSDHEGSGTSAFLTAHPDWAGLTVKVQGTFDGKPFTYTGAPHVEIENEFNPPVNVDSTGINFTMHADISTWFRSATGSLIDPSTATQGTTNAEIVASNIQRSFHAYRDDNRNGEDDQTEHSGGSH